MFGLTHGEIGLAAFVFALIYGAGLIPKIAKLLAGSKNAEDKRGE